MIQLSGADLEAVRVFQEDTASMDATDPITPALVDRLRRLVGAEETAFCELDHVRRRWLGQVDCPDEPAVPDPLPRLPDEFWDLCTKSPENRYQARHNGRATKLSDRRSRRRRLELVDPYGLPGPWDVISIDIGAPPLHTRKFLCSRPHDFDERDRAVLDLIRPQLAARHRLVKTRVRLDAALAMVEDGSGRAAFLVTPDGEIELASPRARELLGSWLGVERRLPRQLVDWHSATPNGAFVRERSGRRLVVERGDSADVLFVREESDPPPLPLTRREREILELVAEGRSNGEIAQILWIATATVKKHLEHVYGKLGVRSRTAALARVERRPTG